MREALVVGGGVSGLSCAVRLAEAGFAVRVWTRDRPADTTSGVAAAIWYPYRAEPADRVLRWGRVTLAELTRLAGVAGTGVALRAGVEIFPAPVPDPPWRAAVPGFRRARPDELPPGYADGYAMTLPVADMGVYLGWLGERVAGLGGRVERRVAGSLDEALDACPLVVNCSGLGARELAADPTVYAVRGQVVRVRAPAVERFLLDEHGPGGLAYVVPRGGDVVLGGTADEHAEELRVDPAAAAVRRRCEALEPGLAGAPVRSEAVGLRPCRPTVRLEAERRPGGGTVVHDYGHGGAGVTLSWGCAADVVALVLGVAGSPAGSPVGGPPG